MSNRQQNTIDVSQQQRNRLAQWEMEYGHPLELDEDLRGAYESLHGGGGQ